MVPPDMPVFEPITRCRTGERDCGAAESSVIEVLSKCGRFPGREIVVAGVENGARGAAVVDGGTDHLDAVQLGEHAVGDQFGDRAQPDVLGCSHHDGIAAQVKGMVRMVRREEDSHAVGREVAQQFQHPGLIAQVQRRDRLVEDHERGVRRQRPGNQHELPLATGQFGEAALREVGDPDALEHLTGARDVGLAGDRERREILRPAHHDHVEHRVSEARQARLRDVPDRIVALDVPFAQRRQPGDGAQQRRLALAVGAQDGGDAALDPQVRVADTQSRRG
ncbi:hypothetical protein J2X34_004895 [Rhodococcus sp. BE178]